MGPKITKSIKISICRVMRGPKFPNQSQYQFVFIESPGTHFIKGLVLKTKILFAITEYCTFFQIYMYGIDRKGNQCRFF